MPTLTFNVSKVKKGVMSLTLYYASDYLDCNNINLNEKFLQCNTGYRLINRDDLVVNLYSIIDIADISCPIFLRKKK